MKKLFALVSTKGKSKQQLKDELKLAFKKFKNAEKKIQNKGRKGSR